MDEDFSAQLRKAMWDTIVCPTCHGPRYTLVQVSNASLIPQNTLRRFLKGYPATMMTVDKIIAFLKAQGVTVKP